MPVVHSIGSLLVAVALAQSLTRENGYSKLDVHGGAVDVNYGMSGSKHPGGDGDKVSNADPNSPNDPNDTGKNPFVDLFGMGEGFLTLTGPSYDDDDYGWVQREYVWSPDYVDEIVATFSEGGLPYWLLTDANYNVMAVVNGSGAVVEQYMWTPYGRVAAADYAVLGDNGAPFNNRIGHQGLFFDRFDLLPDVPVLDPAAWGAFYNRNRHYSPMLGRFLQKDVNETAMPIVIALVFNGGTIDTLLSVFDALVHYRGGMNLYEYLGSNPVNSLDPSGLDDIDDVIDELQGQKIYAIGMINEGARWAAIGLETALEVASAVLGIDVFQSVSVLASGKGGFWESMDVVVAAIPGGEVFRFIQIAKKIKRVAKAGKYAGKLIRHHTVPKAVLKRLNPRIANHPLVRGKRGSPNIWKIPEELHKDIHRGARGGPWNDAWWDELGKLGGPEKADVQDIVLIRDRLINMFGLTSYRP